MARKQREMMLMLISLCPFYSAWGFHHHHHHTHAHTRPWANTANVQCGSPFPSQTSLETPSPTRSKHVSYAIPDEVRVEGNQCKGGGGNGIQAMGDLGSRGLHRQTNKKQNGTRQSHMSFIFVMAI